MAVVAVVNVVVVAAVVAVVVVVVVAHTIEGSTSVKYPVIHKILNLYYDVIHD